MAANKIIGWVIATSLLVVATVALLSLIHHQRRITLRGAVIRQDTDPSKQAPIADVNVTVTADGAATQVRSDQTGMFTVTLPKGVRNHDLVSLLFIHEDYKPLQLSEITGDGLYVARMTPVATPAKGAPGSPQPQVISNIRVRYVVRSTEIADVGSAVKTFQVANNGNVPCQNHPVCSPDKKWKAAVGSVTLDAGEGNEFRNVRVSCIAGPCPFTQIEHETPSAEGQHLTVAARSWSDTATFLVEAQVTRPAENDVVRQSYPAIFGPSLSFTLPASAEGPSIEAELNGEAIVFPLPPSLLLRWAQCTQGKINEQVIAYRCELKPGYRFQ